MESWLRGVSLTDFAGRTGDACSATSLAVTFLVSIEDQSATNEGLHSNQLHAENLPKYVSVDTVSTNPADSGK